MTEILLVTQINAPIDRVFDLARSIDLHQFSTSKTNEKAISGITTGLKNEGETVTWRAKHLGMYQKLTVRIIEMNKPHHFTDIMTKGAFKHMRHFHIFEETLSGTRMVDKFEFSSPLGLLGRLVDILFLKKYMTNFLGSRNEVIKSLAETDKWKEFLP